MPAWTQKDERQYEHIRDGYIEQGKSEDRAEEIAARTVNKQRRTEGRTPNRTTQGMGNPRTGLEQRTVAELRNIAAGLHVSGRTKMKKADLVAAIRAKRG